MCLGFRGNSQEALQGKRIGENEKRVAHIVEVQTRAFTIYVLQLNHTSWLKETIISSFATTNLSNV